MADSLRTTGGLSPGEQGQERPAIERTAAAGPTAWRVRRADPPAPVREEARRLERVEQLLRSDRQS